MNTKPLLIVVLILAFASIACNFSINLPERSARTGPTVVEDIAVEAPAQGQSANLSLAFGAGKLSVSPGAADMLVSGTASYNVPEFKPEVSVSGSRVRIEQGEQLRVLPNLGRNLVNEWDLQLGESPMSLRITAGAYEGRYELGGLAIEELEISDGAAESRVTFSELNQVEMSSLRYTTGASSVTLEGLANANFEDMFFRSGAGSYTLDFSGELQRDTTVTIESGLGNVRIVLPPGVSGRVTFDGGLSNVDVGGDWTRSGNDYVQDGSGPEVTFLVKMGAGNLELRSR